MAKDLFHDNVRRALEKDGWTITHDPYWLDTHLLEDPLKIDLGAEKLIAAEKGSEKIAVEIKSFLGDSLIYDFHGALGQMASYQINIEVQEPARILILAIPFFTFEKMQMQPFYDIALSRYGIKYLVFHPDNDEILQWKK